MMIKSTGVGARSARHQSCFSNPGSLVIVQTKHRNTRSLMSIDEQPPLPSLEEIFFLSSILSSADFAEEIIGDLAGACTRKQSCKQQGIYPSRHYCVMDCWRRS